MLTGMQMSPSLLGLDAPNVVAPNSISRGDGALGFCGMEYFQHLRRREFSGLDCRSDSAGFGAHAALSNCIRDVVCGCPQEQVIGVDAGPIITAVANIHVLRDRTIGKLPHDSVSKSVSDPIGNERIAIRPREPTNMASGQRLWDCVAFQSRADVFQRCSVFARHRRLYHSRRVRASVRFISSPRPDRESDREPNPQTECGSTRNADCY